MKLPEFILPRAGLVVRFMRFCIVGTTGLFVDMRMFFLLADLRMLGLDISLIKALAAETVTLNNYLWTVVGQNRWRARAIFLLIVGDFSMNLKSTARPADWPLQLPSSAELSRNLPGGER